MCFGRLRCGEADLGEEARIPPVLSAFSRGFTGLGGCKQTGPMRHSLLPDLPAGLRQWAPPPFSLSPFFLLSLLAPRMLHCEGSAGNGSFFGYFLFTPSASEVLL